MAGREFAEGELIHRDFDPDAPQSELTLPGVDEGEILVIRSTRRKKTISAYRQGGKIVVSIPARMTKAQEREIVPEMVASVRRDEAKRTPAEGALAERIVELLTQLAPEITERATSVTWRTMRERWGSCTTADGTIRISDRLKAAPAYALDYVLFHEGIHLRFGDHGPEFQEALARFPEKEVARAYLDGYEAAERFLLPSGEAAKLLGQAGS